MRRRAAQLIFCMACCALASEAAGDETATPAEASQALDHFVRGTELARQARWAEALASFERAAKIKPHAITTYNMAACERAIGRYTRARGLFRHALDQHRASGGTELPETLFTQTHGFLGELDGLLARVTLTVVPARATIAVDGAPLERETPSARGARAIYVAGTRKPAAAEAIAESSFDVLLDPGAHVFTITRKGFEPAVVNKTFAAKARAKLRLELDRLPATLHIRSNQKGAIVLVDGEDVGPAPVDLLRPAGRYKIEVRKDGFVTYEMTLQVSPGEESNVRARLLEDTPSIAERWWFWTAAGAVVTGGVLLTYFLARPEPEPPPYDGGSSGWVVQPEPALLRW